jgi:hypothetical protein
MTKDEQTIAHLNKPKSVHNGSYGADIDRAIGALEREPCDDAVSRSQALKELEESAKYHANDSREEMLLRRDRDIIKALPPVTPVRPKGHWIMTSDYLTTAYGSVDYVKCSCCGEDSLEEGNYCPNCGAEMREVGKE